ncbi:hypothetical protein PFMALIP_05602 [Plasmodium falciparum MaliPS096_E11]|uniref:Uncharacterized protein n=1 Tax=Plasmodium falciparum MaliPS096_E11 TaxID=1036727 RepID=A0A024WI64_PLAFA|nr:hypothetical protein PFMALIP_05602 [Plasmodium falciparum MaliPS096_E11]
MYGKKYFINTLYKKNCIDNIHKVKNKTHSKKMNMITVVQVLVLHFPLRLLVHLMKISDIYIIYIFIYL